MDDSKKTQGGGDEGWLSNLTSSDGTDIKFDPLLLEEESPPASTDSGDGYTDDDGMVDKYDELGRTPPRTSLAKNRKWSNDKKLHREHEKR